MTPEESYVDGCDRLEAFVRNSKLLVIRLLKENEGLRDEVRRLRTEARGLRSALRAEEAKKYGKVYRMDDLVLDPDSRCLMQSGHYVRLTTYEFDVLQQLMDAAPKCCTRRELADWTGVGGGTYERAVDTHVKNIRKKLGGSMGRYIRTVIGSGYVCAADVTLVPRHSTNDVRR